MRLILLAPPGAGKGTQAEKIVKRLNIPQLSTGDMLRAAVQAGSEIGKKAKAVMDAGKLVSDDIVNAIISERLDEKDCAGGFILDGYPRTLVQADSIENMLEQKNMALDAVIELQVDDEKMIERIAGRFSCASCGSPYNFPANMPEKRADAEGAEDEPTASLSDFWEKSGAMKNRICGSCGGSEFSRRDDDNEKAMGARLQAYHRQTAPLIGYYYAKGKLKSVDGMAEIEAVESEIARFLGR